jgi:membrane-bound serine protease (ClpP class)
VRNWIPIFCALLLAMTPGASRADEAPPAKPAGPAKVVVIPVKEQIAPPELYILRRGLKEAIDNGVQTIVLDMDTPGGRVDVTFDMLKALEKFPGKTVTYINSNAISAGALISAGTDEIYFAPNGVIGAAAPVSGDGTDIDETMQAKMVSYLKARVRSLTDGKGYRAEVISAMIDLKSEFKIGEVVIKEKDELLSLTAQEALKEYGEPPVPLLAAGIVKDMDELLDRIHGKGNWSMKRLEVTWSEKLAQYLTSIAPLLMAIGMVALFIEFKTPGFGFFGIAGGLLLAVVFLGHYVAGLSGHEPMLFFALGVILVAVEIFFFPGSIAFAVAGVALMLGSLVWSMADLWPRQPIEFTADVFLQPLMSVGIGVGLAVLIFILLLRFLPSGGPWGRLVLDAAVGGEPHGPQPLLAGGGASFTSLVGESGVAVTALMPTGQVSIGGRRYEGKLSVGYAEAGTPVVVTRHGEFSLEVEVIPS